MTLYDICKKYINDLSKTRLSGKATEASYYPSLKSFLETYVNFKAIDVEVIVQPKQTEAGMPDFLLRSHNMIVGNIEAKDLSAKLDEILKTKQIRRYRNAYPNLILTDFFTFILYRNGKKYGKVTIADKNTLLLAGRVPKISDVTSIEKQFDKFLGYVSPPTYTSKQLAIELAKRAKQLSENIFMELKNDNEVLSFIYNNIKEQLIPSLTLEAFADIYAQTLVYGFFFARIQAGSNQFNRINAYSYLPGNIPLLKRLFYIMQDPSLVDPLKWIFDDIVTILNNADIESIMKSFHTKLWSEDPIIHFYETFLSVFNPEERQRRGVYYTPEPVVAYIVSSIHELLVQIFKKHDGLADRSITLLDPASGTLTFPMMALKLIHENFIKQGKGGIFPNLVREHILINYFAFELLLAPYVIGHFKAFLTMEDLNCKLDQERFQLYLTNSLELALPKYQQTLFPELSNERISANKIKSDPIFVILGNPPYSVSSENKSEFIETLMADYKEDVRSEKNIQPLSDDYIKFLRFAHWKIIENSDKGIIGMITNNAYLDGLIHRGMRKKLYEAFDHIFILNLHGNLRSREKTPTGGKDENVFDIQQGVAIAFFIKNNDEKKFCYADLWGLRKLKYKWLLSHNVSTTKWQNLDPTSPYYWFVPRQEKIQYQDFSPLNELMPFHRQGVKTHRDWLVVGFVQDEITSRIESLKTLSEDEIISALHLTERKRASISHAKKLISELSEVNENKVIEYMYRPFDSRYIYYDHKLLDRPRPELFNQTGSIFLLTRRNSRQWPGEWSFAFVTKKLPDIDMRGGVYAFPLIVNGRSNLSKELIKWAQKQFGNIIVSEDLLGYIYAILFCNEYRLKYADELRTEFPRIPFTKNKERFLQLCKIGRKLIMLHFLIDPEIEILRAGFPQIGSDVIERVEYDSDNIRVIINEKQWFSNVSKDVWNYEVGGYKICQRWLKERTGRRLNSDEQIKYMKIVGAIKKTIELQKEIDIIYPQIEAEYLIMEKQRTQQNLKTYSNTF